MVKADTINTFKNRHDKHWITQDAFTVDCEAYARSYYRHSVRPSVRLSNAWIVTKRDNCL